jgi:hypothetical protein
MDERFIGDASAEFLEMLQQAKEVCRTTANASPIVQIVIVFADGYAVCT